MQHTGDGPWRLSVRRLLEAGAATFAPRACRGYAADRVLVARLILTLLLSTFGRSRVFALNQFLDLRTRFLCRERVVSFNAAHLCRHTLVLDGLVEPLRILAGTQMVHPRLIVDAFRQLKEYRQVLRPQI